MKIDELVASVARLGRGRLCDTEKELGVAVADIGAGTIDLALYADGSPFHTGVLPVGGNNVTNDVAIGLKTTLQVAEELKIRHGTGDLRASTRTRQISVAVLGEEAGRTVSRLEVCQIIEARMRETFELLRAEMQASGHGVLPGGIILTGGGGAAGRGRRARPRDLPDAGPGRRAVRRRRLVDNLLTPVYSASVGLLMWGAASVDGRRAVPLRIGARRRAASAGSATRSAASSLTQPTPGSGAVGHRSRWRPRHRKVADRGPG